MINQEKVKHIANLARLSVTEAEIPKYEQQLGDILTEIEKIVNVPIGNEEMMISPTKNENCYREDVIGTHINKEDALKNTKHRKGDYIAVPKVIE